MYHTSKILFSFGYLLVSFVYSKVFYLWLQIIFHISLYLYSKVVFRYIGRSIRFREQRSRRNRHQHLSIVDLSVVVSRPPKGMG